MNPKEFKLIYFDIQKGERPIRDARELQRTLTDLQENASIPQSVNLVSPNGDVLTIAVGANFGFVQFESASPNSPYLIAVDNQKKSMENYRNVDAGGTLTPIPERACLSVERVIEIVLFYFDHMTIPDYVEWEEV